MRGRIAVMLLILLGCLLCGATAAMLWRIYYLTIGGAEFGIAACAASIGWQCFAAESYRVAGELGKCI